MVVTLRVSPIANCVAGCQYAYFNIEPISKVWGASDMLWASRMHLACLPKTHGYWQIGYAKMWATIPETSHMPPGLYPPETCLWDGNSFAVQVLSLQHGNAAELSVGR